VKKSWNDYRLEVMASARTVLNILEKALDGVPIPGPKAVVGAASEILKARQVRVTQIHSSIIKPTLQTSVENEEAISDIVKTVEDTQKDLIASIRSAFDPSLVTSPEVEERIAELLRWVTCRPYGQITKFSSDLNALRTSVEQNSNKNKNAGRRLLDAERISNEISAVMLKIKDVDVRFLVRELAEVCMSIGCSLCGYEQMRTTVSTENKVDNVRHELKQHNELGKRTCAYYNIQPC
jgi:NADH:ubiquinone oxidoreductase subunit E